MEGRVCPGDRNRTGSLLCRHQVSLVDLGKYSLITMLFQLQLWMINVKQDRKKSVKISNITNQCNGSMFNTQTSGAVWSVAVGQLTQPHWDWLYSGQLDQLLLTTILSEAVCGDRDSRLTHAASRAGTAGWPAASLSVARRRFAG